MLLVKYTKDNALKIFALKQMKKVHILETKQEEHVFNERRIMLSCESFAISSFYSLRFVHKLCRTAKSNRKSFDGFLLVAFTRDFRT